MKQVRQGDLYITRIDEMPKGVILVKDSVLLKGEVTGHMHRMVGANVYKNKTGAMYFSVAKKATLVHEDHGPIEFSRGKYAVLRQREYVSADMVRVVVD